MDTIKVRQEAIKRVQDIQGRPIDILNREDAIRIESFMDGAAFAFGMDIGKVNIYTNTQIKVAFIRYFKTTIGILRQKSRLRSLVYKRQLFAYCMYNLGKNRMTDIAKVLNQDHSTVVTSIQKMRLLVASDVGVRIDYKQVKGILEGKITDI